MKYRPLHDCVLVKRNEAKKKTDGGILLPDNAQEKVQEGKVIAVGPGKLQDDGSRAPMQVKKGDLVVFPKYAGNEVGEEGEGLIMLTESVILGVLE